MFCALLVAGCAQTGSLPDGDPTPIVVRLLDLNQVPVTLAAPENAAAITPSSTPVVLQLAQPTATFTPTPPSDLASPVPASPLPPTAVLCRNAAEFVKHLMTSDNTVIPSGAPFVKIWQIKNVGTCVWTTLYTLNFYSGEPMGSQPSLPLSAEVKPGETIDLRLDLISPVAAGTYTGNWALKDPEGNLFGIGPDANQPLAVTIIVPRQPFPTPG